MHVLSSAMPASTEARRSTLIQPLPACPSTAHHQGYGSILIQWHFHQRHVQAYIAHEVPLSAALFEPPKIHIFPLVSRTAE